MEMETSGFDDARATITITDVEQGAQGKVLASGTIVCNISSGLVG